MGRLVAGKVQIPTDGRCFSMVRDLAMFEPNDRGIRAFDRYLAGPARRLPEHERQLAQRMGNGFFSLFRCAGTRDDFGTWFEDILDDDRRYWLGDTEPEGPEVRDRVFAARIFDGGPYYAMLARPAPPGVEMIEICLKAQKNLGHHPFSRSLAATLYGMIVPGELPDHPSGRKFQRDLYDALDRHGLLPHRDGGVARVY
jgi:hypothetical protein